MKSIPSKYLLDAGPIIKAKAKITLLKDKKRERGSLGDYCRNNVVSSSYFMRNGEAFLLELTAPVP